MCLNKVFQFFNVANPLAIFVCSNGKSIRTWFFRWWCLCLTLILYQSITELTLKKRVSIMRVGMKSLLQPGLKLRFKLNLAQFGYENGFYLPFPFFFFISSHQNCSFIAWFLFRIVKSIDLWDKKHMDIPNQWKETIIWKKIPRQKILLWGFKN